MKRTTLYRFLAILIIITPFLGLYDYLKDTLFIIFGLTLLVSVRSPKKRVKESTILDHKPLPKKEEVAL